MADGLEWRANTEWQATTDFGVYRVRAERGTVWLMTPGAHQGTPCLPDIVTAKAVAEMHFREVLKVREQHRNMQDEDGCCRPLTSKSDSKK